MADVRSVYNLDELRNDKSKWPVCKYCHEPIPFEKHWSDKANHWMRAKFCDRVCADKGHAKRFKAMREKASREFTDDIRKWPVCRYRKCGKPIPYNYEKHKLISVWRKMRYCSISHSQLEASILRKASNETKLCGICHKQLWRRGGETARHWDKRRFCAPCKREMSSVEQQLEMYEPHKEAVKPGFYVFDMIQVFQEPRRNPYPECMPEYLHDERDQKLDEICNSLLI